MKVSCERSFCVSLAEGNCMSVSECGEEAGVQNLDLMNKNRVKRHAKPGELAIDSKAQKDVSGCM